MSSEIKRYELFNDKTPVDSHVLYMEEYKTGRYCKYEDIQKLEAKVKELDKIIEINGDKIQDPDNENWYYHYIEKCSELHDEINAKEKLEKELAELNEATRWRDVREELPESKGSYWSVLKWEREIVTRLCSFENGEWFYNHIGVHVTHWIPLPKANQEGAE